MEYKELINGPDKIIWSRGTYKELARLSQGSEQHNIKGTDTIIFLHPRVLPPGKKPTYARI
jgi:hypothetical protein